MTEKIPVMVNGLPGKMATEMARKIDASDDFKLYNFGLTGPNFIGESIEINGKSIHLYSPERKRFLRQDLNSIFPENGLVVDFTRPDATTDNAKFYCDNGWSFVMGTTGTDLPKIEEMVKRSNVKAIIASNFAAPIVSLEEFLKAFSEKHEGEFNHYEIRVVESHQGPDPKRPEFKGKIDPSGTAIRFSNYFAKMGVYGCPFNMKDIMQNPDKYKDRFDMIRNRNEQIGVPTEHKDAHGWHRYELVASSVKSLGPLADLYVDLLSFFSENNPALRGYEITNNPRNLSTHAVSPDKSVFLSFDATEDKSLFLTHNINGRSVYADGGLEALRFIAKDEERGRVKSMLDVMRLKS